MESEPDTRATFPPSQQLRSQQPTPVISAVPPVAPASGAAHASSSSGPAIDAESGARLDRFVSAVDDALAALDGLADLTEAETLRLQTYLDRRSHFYSMLSNLMKKDAENASNVAGNLT